MLKSEMELINKYYSIEHDGQIYSEITDKYLKYDITKNGYARVMLLGKHYSVARLVAAEYIGLPKLNQQINHIDGNKLNNHVSNLEWVTCKENIVHAYKNHLTDWQRRFTDKQVAQLRTCYKSGKYTMRALATKYKCSSATIHKNLRRLITYDCAEYRS